MADQEKSKSGAMQLVLGLVIVTVIGLGAGFGLSAMFPKPDPAAIASASASFAAKPPADSHAKADVQGTNKDHGVTAVEPPPPIAAAAAADFNPADLKDVVLTPFAPITANIAVPDTVWLRLEGSMAVKPKDGVKPADVVQLASNKMVAYVKTLKLTDIQGPVGFLALNSDLNEIVRNATDGQARSVLISGFIVE
jgi:flagellar FliL protein